MQLFILFFFIISSLHAIDRQQVSQEKRWDIEALFSDFTAWQKEYEELLTQEIAFEKYKGKLSTSPEMLYQLFLACEEYERRLDKLTVFARFSLDVDVSCEEAKKATGSISSLYSRFQEQSSWIIPEILAMPEDRIQEYLQDPNLTKYQFYLQNMRRSLPYIISPDCEALLAKATLAHAGAPKAFSALVHGEFHFDPIYNQKQEQHSLTNANYLSYLHADDQHLRKNAFLCMHKKYNDFANTLTELLHSHVLSHLFQKSARGYNSCLEAALFPSNIDPEVYHTLISTVRSRIDVLHRYIALRKKVLGLSELHSYDLYVPLIHSSQRSVQYDEAVEIVLEAVKPLGTEYTQGLEQGLKQDRWADPFENNNKVAGAYSGGCYDSMPYMLLNFDNTIGSVITLAHEAGHSMHSFMSKKYQPFTYHCYNHFVAEVASLCNEELLTCHLLKNTKNQQEKAYIISEILERMRQTIFRQTLFAEFELYIHELVEKNIPLTPKQLCEKYSELVQFYYGKDLTFDPLIGIEWARIPHFYKNFYVYQYATGMSAAIALSKKITESDEAKEAYLTFLKSGASDYALNVLAKAGVDMRTSEPIHVAIDRFSAYMDELEALLNN